jgi:hypothetical protein
MGLALLGLLVAIGGYALQIPAGGVCGRGTGQDCPYSLSPGFGLEFVATMVTLIGFGLLAGGLLFAFWTWMRTKPSRR